MNKYTPVKSEQDPLLQKSLSSAIFVQSAYLEYETGQMGSGSHLRIPSPELASGKFPGADMTIHISAMVFRI